jgi:hypothetical protein
MTLDEKYIYSKIQDMELPIVFQNNNTFVKRCCGTDRPDKFFLLWSPLLDRFTHEYFRENEIVVTIEINNDGLILDLICNDYAVNMGLEKYLLMYLHKKYQNVSIRLPFDSKEESFYFYRSCGVTILEDI